MTIYKAAIALATSLMLLNPVFAQAPAPAPVAPASTPAAVVVAEPVMRLARDLVEASGIGRSFDATMPDIALRIRQTFATQRPEIVKDMDDTLVALLPEIRTRRGEIVERTARTIGGMFTEAELKELVAFFNTNTGKKYVNNQPTLLNEVFVAMDPWMKQTSDFFLSRFREEMRKKGHTV